MYHHLPKSIHLAPRLKLECDFGTAFCQETIVYVFSLLDLILFASRPRLFYLLMKHSAMKKCLIFKFYHLLELILFAYRPRLI